MNKMSIENTIKLIMEKNNGQQPKIGGSMISYCGSDCYSFKIIAISDDKKMVTGIPISETGEVNYNLSPIYGMLVTDRRKKNLYGRYIEAMFINRFPVTIPHSSAFSFSDNCVSSYRDPSF